VNDSCKSCCGVNSPLQPVNDGPWGVIKSPAQVDSSEGVTLCGVAKPSADSMNCSRFTRCAGLGVYRGCWPCLGKLKINRPLAG
jgi:hypothetical protein